MKNYIVKSVEIMEINGENASFAHLEDGNLKLVKAGDPVPPAKQRIEHVATDEFTITVGGKQEPFRLGLMSEVERTPLGNIFFLAKSAGILAEQLEKEKIGRAEIESKLARFESRGFWQRLKFLVTGKC